MTWLQRLGRFFTGLLLGYLWFCVVMAAEVGVLVLIYGSLDAALTQTPPRSLADSFFVASTVAAYGSWFGGIIGPLLMPAKIDKHMAIYLASAYGGLFSALIGVAIGFPAGPLVMRSPMLKESAVGLELALAAYALFVGGWGGWLGGRIARRHSAPEAPTNH